MDKNEFQEVLTQRSAADYQRSTQDAAAAKREQNHAALSSSFKQAAMAFLVKGGNDPTTFPALFTAAAKYLFADSVDNLFAAAPTPKGNISLSSSDAAASGVPANSPEAPTRQAPTGPQMTGTMG